MQAREEKLNWLDGYIQGVTSLNGMVKGHPKVSGSAFLMEDVSGNVDVALSDYHREVCTSLTDVFPDMDVALFEFEPAEVRSDWMRWLHLELEQSLLPSPIRLDRVLDRAHVDTRYSVAWNVVERVGSIAENDYPPHIYKARFARRDEYLGCAYVIPLKDGGHLVLRFQTKCSRE